MRLLLDNFYFGKSSNGYSIYINIFECEKEDNYKGKYLYTCLAPGGETLHINCNEKSMMLFNQFRIVINRMEDIPGGNIQDEFNNLKYINKINDRYKELERVEKVLNEN